MADPFPAIERRFKADALCVKYCRKLYDSVAAKDAQFPFVTFEHSGGEDMSTWGETAERIDATFVMHSGHVQPAKMRRMAAEIFRAFSGRKLNTGEARISMHVTGPAEVTREENLYEARLPFDVFVVLRSEVPASIGVG